MAAFYFQLTKELNMKLPKHITAHEHNFPSKGADIILCHEGNGLAWVVNRFDLFDIATGIKHLNTGHGWNYETNKHLFGDVYHSPLEINHKELLKKYIAHVVGCEGTDFMSNIEYGDSDMKFTDEEFKELERLS